MKFILDLIKKYKCNLGYKILSQLEAEELSDLKSITKHFSDSLFDIDLESELENNENINEDIESEIFK